MEHPIRIAEINEYNLPYLSGILMNYLKERERILDDIPDIDKTMGDLSESVKSGMEKGIFAEKNNEPTGILLYKEINGCLQIKHFYVEKADHESGKKLVDNVKKTLQSSNELFYIHTVLIPELSNFSSSSLNGLGFRLYERYIMERILNNPVENESNYKLQDRFIINRIENKCLWGLAEALYLTNLNNIDREIRPGIFDSQWMCFLFLRQIEKNVFGPYNEETSFSISEENKMLGAIFGTFKQTGEAFIPAFFIHPDYQGYGLGRALISRQMKAFHEAKTKKISLCVTAANGKACELYLSSGFKIVRKYFESFQYKNQLTSPPERLSQEV